jgi:hypothetical protein
MNAVPRGDISHLYAAAATTPKRVASSGSQPAACVASTTVSTSCTAAARAIASRPATSPEVIWTALKAATSVCSSMASDRSAGGTMRTSSSGRTMNGNSVEVNSTSGITTRAPRGSEPATSATRPETVAPIATRPGSVPIMAANAARERSTPSSQTCHGVRPLRQSASAACIASQPGCGGSP